MKSRLSYMAVMIALLLAAAGCGGGIEESSTKSAGSTLPAAAARVADERGLSPENVAAALKTYVPSGQYDEYLMFASGGHSGQALVYGLPSMRLLRVIGVFTPEPWQGWGFNDETRAVLEQGKVNGKTLTWGDTHHPALSETNGDYDGEWLFINDKAHARVAVIDLRDFETKQIVSNPLTLSDHGSTFVTPNTEYVIEGGQYAAPIGSEYAPLSEYQEKYRSVVTFWKFDRNSGRIDQEKSWSIELPPYWQDLADAGKLVSDGWVFLNSINTEMATGADGQGSPPFEAGVSQRDMDYMHVIDWRKAEKVVESGKAETIKGMRMISLETAIDEGLLYFIPEPKSPHGVDVTPKGDYMVVSGKLDPQVTVYSFDKIQQAIKSGEFTYDPYGVPILDFDATVEVQVEVGLGPLHTQFDNQGYAYTSLFLESAVARWSLGDSYRTDGAEGWKLMAKTPVQYNVGHVAAAEGDTVSPDGKYLVSLNKWAIDRYDNTGPLMPQNLQLIDISAAGGQPPVLYDAPVGVGEPHYAQIIKADKIKAWKVYPEVGWDPAEQRPSEKGVRIGEERIERRGDTVEIWMSAVRSHFTPERIEVNEGDKVIWHITNVETTRDATHGFALPVFNVNVSLEPGETTTFTFVADKPGTYSYYCTEFCSALHLEMAGYFLVKPATSPKS